MALSFATKSDGKYELSSRFPQASLTAVRTATQQPNRFTKKAGRRRRRGGNTYRILFGGPTDPSSLRSLKKALGSDATKKRLESLKAGRRRRRR